MTEPLDIARMDASLELTLNRPARRNALSRDLIVRLTTALQEAATQPQIRCVVISGAPPAFCAGLDLREVAESTGQDAAHDTTLLFALYQTIEQLPLPVIAAVNGPAVAGGAALLCACDVAICGESATVSYPGIRHGLVAPIVMPSLVRLAGERRARYLLLTGEPISASQTVTYGLASEVVADAQLLPRVRQLAADLAVLPPQGAAQTKALLNRLRHTAAGPSADEIRRWAASVAVTDEARPRLANFLDS